MVKRKYDPLWANITTEEASEIREQFAVLQETNERLKADNTGLARALQEARQEIKSHQEHLEYCFRNHVLESEVADLRAEVEQWKANAHHHGADAHRLASELVDAQKAVAEARRETFQEAARLMCQFCRRSDKYGVAERDTASDIFAHRKNGARWCEANSIQQAAAKGEQK